jgi:hypothetical protein
MGRGVELHRCSSSKMVQRQGQELLAKVVAMDELAVLTHTQEAKLRSNQWPEGAPRSSPEKWFRLSLPFSK